MDLRKARTLKLLSESLKGLLAEKPYADITVSEICEGAMVRRATFYRHFGGKDDLLKYAFTQERARVDETVDPDGILSLPAYCHAMTAQFLLLLRDYQPILKTQALSPAFSRIFMLFTDEIATRFEEKMRDSLTGEEEEAMATMARFYAHGLVGATAHFLHANPSLNEQAFLARIDEIAYKLFA